MRYVQIVVSAVAQLENCRKTMEKPLVKGPKGFCDIVLSKRKVSLALLAKRVATNFARKAARPGLPELLLFDHGICYFLKYSAGKPELDQKTFCIFEKVFTTI